MATRLWALASHRESERSEFYGSELSRTLAELREVGPQDAGVRQRARVNAKAILDLVNTYEDPGSRRFGNVKIACCRILVAAGHEGPADENALRELQYYAQMNVRLCLSMRDFLQLGHAYLDQAQVCRLFEADDMAYRFVNTAYHCLRTQSQVPRFRSQSADVRLSLARGLYEATQYKHRLQTSLVPLKSSAKSAGDIWRELSSVGRIVDDMGHPSSLLQAHREAVGHYSAEGPDKDLDAAYEHLESMKRLQTEGQLAHGTLTYYHNTFARVEVEFHLAQRTVSGTEAAVHLIENEYLAYTCGHAHYWRQLAKWKKTKQLRDLRLPAAAIQYGSPVLIFNL